MFSRQMLLSIATEQEGCFPDALHDL